MFGGKVDPTVVWHVHSEEDRVLFYIGFEPLSPGPTVLQSYRKGDPSTLDLA